MTRWTGLSSPATSLLCVYKLPNYSFSDPNLVLCIGVSDFRCKNT